MNGAHKNLKLYGNRTKENKEIAVTATWASDSQKDKVEKIKTKGSALKNPKASITVILGFL